MMKKFTIVFSTLILCSFLGYSQQPDDVLGKWKTIDDETGKPKSIVEIYKKGDKVYGKVIKILNPDKQDARCDNCDEDDDRKGQKTLGMEIIRDMEWDDDEWDDGTILDPNKGSVYDCKLWIESDDPNKLYVRGYIAFIYRTQYWYRQK